MFGIDCLNESNVDYFDSQDVPQDQGVVDIFKFAANTGKDLIKSQQLSLFDSDKLIFLDLDFLHQNLDFSQLVIMRTHL